MLLPAPRRHSGWDRPLGWPGLLGTEIGQCTVRGPRGGGPRWPHTKPRGPRPVPGTRRVQEVRLGTLWSRLDVRDSRGAAGVPFPGMSPGRPACRQTPLLTCPSLRGLPVETHMQHPGSAVRDKNTSTRQQFPKMYTFISRRHAYTLQSNARSGAAAAGSHASRHWPSLEKPCLRAGSGRGDVGKI